MSQRRALVTGSSSGIGRAISERLLAAGWAVVGLARDHDKYAPDHGDFHPETIDLSDLDSLPDRLKELVRHYPFDAVVSSAGQGDFGALESYSVEQIRSFLDLNLLSHILVARAVVPGLKKQGAGHLIFMGSESAMKGARKGSLYCTAKFGLRGLAQSLREECSTRSVKVTLINPGLVRTPFFDTLDFRPGDDVVNAIDPKDVAETVHMVLNAGAGAVYDEINLSPLKKVIRFD